MAGLADFFPEEKPLTCFLDIVTNNTVYTVLKIILHAALYTTVCTVLNITMFTVLYTVPYTILYTDAKSGITKFIVFLTEYCTVNLPQNHSL